MKVNKYRSWNNIAKCFYYYMIDKYFDSCGNIVTFYDFNWCNAEQYIGITDENNKEVYGKIECC